MRRATLGAGCGLVGVVLLVGMFGPLADMMASNDLHSLPKSVRAEKQAAARDAARGRLVQILAGLLGIGAFAFTARSFRLAREQGVLNRQTLQHAIDQAAEQSEATRRSYEQSEAVQITDRFARAIELLGSESVDARLGAIYSLERIARDSPRDHPAIVEVLCAFALRRSQPAEGELRQDLMAAMAVLGRRTLASDTAPLVLRGARLDGLELRGARFPAADLSETSMRRVGLAGADLSGAALTGADLRGAGLDRAKLGGADLTDAVLEGARLASADLSGAVMDRAAFAAAELGTAILREATGTDCRLTGVWLVESDLTDVTCPKADFVGAKMMSCVLTRASLQSAVFSQADLTGATLAAADLTGATLSKTILRGADLTGAVLAGANLSGAQLRDAVLAGVDLAKVRLGGLDLDGAIADERTVLPTGWRREASGRIVRDGPRY